MKVEIILPIYNSPEDTRACIESIIRETPEDSYLLYLLDDCSSDNEITTITEYYSSHFDHIYTTRNDKNLGFPGTVNSGLNMTSQDVILLNSDTLVSAGWLEGLQRAIKSSDNIAAVGPLSNYGLISSVPSIYQEVNDKYPIKEVIACINQFSEHSYPEVPVLSGFCMYISRTAINAVGLLDAKTFKKGYGEETDWCLRARQQGYKLILADDTYVFHVGGVSFGEEKQQRVRISEAVIDKRYPEYRKEITSYDNDHPLIVLRRKMSKTLRVPLKFRLRYQLRIRKKKWMQIVRYNKDRSKVLTD